MTAYVNDTLQAQILRQEIWTGNYYEAVYPGNVLTVLFVTGANEALLSPNINLGGQATIWLNEDTTTSADGTSITNYNLYRASAETLLTTTFHTPTVTGAGTEILKTVSNPDGVISPTTALNPSGGMVLKANSKYRIYILNGSAATSLMSVSWFLREL